MLCVEGGIVGLVCSPDLGVWISATDTLACCPTCIIVVGVSFSVPKL
jgi:hypothetical protein